MNNGAKPEKPDTEQYARVVLWTLAQIKASLIILETDYIASKNPDASHPQILEATKKHGQIVRKQADSIYSEMLRQSNIKPSQTFPHRNE